MKSTPPGFPAWYPGWLLTAERKFWYVMHQLRHPVWYYQDVRKWRARPKVGDMVLAHGEPKMIVAINDKDPDTLILADGSSESWMSCCDPV